MRLDWGGKPSAKTRKTSISRKKKYIDTHLGRDGCIYVRMGTLVWKNVKIRHRGAPRGEDAHGF